MRDRRRLKYLAGQQHTIRALLPALVACQLQCHLAADVSQRQFHDVHAQVWVKEAGSAPLVCCYSWPGAAARACRSSITTKSFPKLRVRFEPKSAKISFFFRVISSQIRI